MIMTIRTIPRARSRRARLALTPVLILALASFSFSFAQRGPEGEGFGPGGPPPRRGGPPHPPGGPGMPPPPPGAEFAPPGWEPDPALLGAIEKDDPEFWKDISRFRTSEPERYRDEVFRWKNRRDRLARLRSEDPERARLIERIDALERQSRKLSDQIRSAPESERGPLKENLVTVLSELFDRREEDRRDEIARLERRLGDLKAGMEDRRAHKDQIVRKRMNEMLEDDDSLRW